MCVTVASIVALHCVFSKQFTVLCCLIKYILSDSAQSKLYKNVQKTTVFCQRNSPSI